MLAIKIKISSKIKSAKSVLRCCSKILLEHHLYSGMVVVVVVKFEIRTDIVKTSANSARKP